MIESYWAQRLYKEHRIMRIQIKENFGDSKFEVKIYNNRWWEF